MHLLAESALRYARGRGLSPAAEKHTRCYSLNMEKVTWTSYFASVSTQNAYLDVPHRFNVSFEFDLGWRAMEMTCRLLIRL